MHQQKLVSQQAFLIYTIKKPLKLRFLWKYISIPNFAI